MFRPALLIMIPALALPILSYRTIVGDSTANAALSGASIVIPPVPDAPVLDMRDEASYAIIIERPLFTPSRRAAAPAVQTVASEAPPAGFTLLGVVSKSGRSLAVIRAGEGTSAIKAEAGQEVAGWQLTKVAPTQVLLERQGGKLELELAFKAPAPAMAGMVMPQPAPVDQAPPAPEGTPQPQVQPAADVPQS